MKGLLSTGPTPYSLLCIMYYVLCLMSFLLCIMSYVFYLMLYILCLMLYVLCNTSWAFGLACIIVLLDACCLMRANMSCIQDTADTRFIQPSPYPG